MIRRFALTAAAGALSLALIASPTSGAKPARASASLNRNLPEMKFDGIALAECVDFLRDITGANIVVNWRAIEAAGVTRDTMVNLNLRNITLKKALSLMLAEASAGEGITYTVEEGVIEITTTELANQRMYMRVYPIGDLLMEIPDFTDAPTFSLESEGGGSGGGGGGGGSSGGSLFGGNGGGGEGEEKDKGKTKQERADELLNLIRDVIYPDIWRENGGPAALRLYRDNLIVTAPRNVHEAIGGTWD